MFSNSTVGCFKLKLRINKIMQSKNKTTSVQFENPPTAVKGCVSIGRENYLGNIHTFRLCDFNSQVAF